MGYPLLIAILLTLTAFVVCRTRLGTRIENTVNASLASWTTAVTSIPLSWVPFAIVLASAAALFSELAIIRIHAGYLHILALLKNISLLSCFLGLGIGFIHGRSSRLLLPIQPLLLLLQLAFLQYLFNENLYLKFGNPFATEHMLGVEAVSGLASVVVITIVVIVFAWNALTFIPLGQLIGALMTRMNGPLAYRYNLLGSILGVALFSLLSYLWIGGSIWILAYGLMIMPFFLRWNGLSLIGLCGILCSACLVDRCTDLAVRHFYSPYQTLSLQLSRDEGVELSTNTLYYQKILNLSDAAVKADPTLARSRRYYELPYELSRAAPSVLVVGSGTGNDVAAALRKGAASVTAIEIDPVIAQLGSSLHPEDPYHSEKTTLIVSDARAYIKRTEARYDAVVYGLLDSHALLSGRVSGLRLDSYVYTVEGLREARALLKPEGILALSFVYMTDEFAAKLYLMLQEAFDGAAPYVFNTSYSRSLTFVAGKGVNAEGIALSTEFQDVSNKFSDGRISTDASTDDWPYFYMPRRIYPVSYLALWIPLLLVSALFLAPAMKAKRFGIDATSFFLGAAFMLLETKAFTEMALVWGTTFSVTAGVIFVILSLAVLANELVIRNFAISSRRAFLLLISSVILGYLATFLSFSGVPWIIEGCARALILTLPILISGICFSRLLTDEQSVIRAMASNLLGAMAGGIFEYTSMVTGFRTLYLGVAAFYILAFLFAYKFRRAPLSVA